MDQVSQLDRDTSAALATIREWRNALTPINRLPLDILSLIPTYLPSEVDRFHASSVCRHWRRTLLRRAELWSELVLTKGEAYVKTLLERAKGSPLAISIRRNRRVPTSTMMLLSPRTEQIRSLKFIILEWAEVQRFIDTNPGPFPLLDSLTFTVQGSPDDPDVIIPPSTRLFSSAANLRKFHFHQLFGWSPSLSHFAFPNLVEFDFSEERSEEFPGALQLLDFLEASPMLRKVDISADVSLEDVPRKRVVVLPNVEELCIIMTYGKPVYKFTTHISCPSITSMSLMHERGSGVVISGETFPTSTLWNTIIRQYTRSPVEEVTLELSNFHYVICDLTLRSSDATVIEMWVALNASSETKDEVTHGVYNEAASAILNHPLANFKHFRTCYNHDFIFSTFTPRIANEIRRLFRSLGPLDELTIFRSDIQPYFRCFLDILEGDVEDPAVFPSIKKLTVSHPTCSSDDECTAAIVGLAQSRHALGVPFEHVTIRASWMPEGVEEGLRAWVGDVEYCYDEPEDD